MKRSTFFLFAMLFLRSLFAQKDSIPLLPEPYEHDRAYQRYYELKDTFDFVLEPILTPYYHANTISDGNIAYDYYDINKHKEVLLPKVEGRVIVFVHDTSCEIEDHPSIPSKSILNELGQNFTNEAGCPDKHSHSTLVSGNIVAHNLDFNLGLAGDLALIQNVAVVPNKVMTSQGAGMMSWVSKSLYHAIELGEKLKDAEPDINIIHNLSLGASQADAETEAAIQAARDAGQLVFVASGNDGRNDISSPADAPAANAIGALTVSQTGTAELSWYSNYGKEQFVTAVGSNTLSTAPGGLYQYWSGTSSATPNAAALAAWAWCIYPSATANQIERAMTLWSTDLGNAGFDEKYGYGTPDMSKYLQIDPRTLPDTPLNEEEPDEPETPTRENRNITYLIKDVRANWARQGENFDVVDLAFSITVQTDLYDADISDQLFFEIYDYFGRSALVLKPEWGYVDATKWWPKFLEYHFADNFPYKIKVNYATGTWGNHTCYTEQFGYDGQIKKLWKAKPATVNVETLTDKFSYIFDVTTEVSKPTHLVGYPYSTVRRNYKFKVHPYEFYNKGADLIIKERLGDVKYEGSYNNKLYSNK